MRKRFVVWFGVVAIPMAQFGCGDSGADGPCEVFYGEPILQITSVSDADSGEAIKEIELWEIDNEPDAGGSGSVRLREADTRSYVEGISEIEGEDERFLCEVPCGFGNQGGVYSFEFKAPGYQASSHSVEATYTGSEGGGCPVTYTDGTETTLELEAE